MRRFLRDSAGSDTTLYTAGDWRHMLGEAGLEEVTGQSQALDLREEAAHQLGRYTLGGILRGMWRALKLLLRRPKDHLALTRASSTTARQFASEMGYGVWAARVPQD